MSIGSFGGIQGSAAGAPLSQTKGSEAERGQQASAATERKADAADKTEKASGIGQTDADQETGDRDADGRRMFEDTLELDSAEGQDEHDGEHKEATRQVDDTTGQAGGQLDMTA